MIYKTTDKQFRLFCREVLLWVGRLGLTDWNVSFSHKAHDDFRAEVGYRLLGRVATFTLSKTWGSKPTTSEVKRVALHEALHLLLADLAGCVGRRYGLTEQDEEIAEHAVLRRLENFLLNPAASR